MIEEIMVREAWLTYVILAMAVTGLIKIYLDYFR